MSEESKKDLEVLWTPQQVSKYLLVNTKTVYNWLSKGTVIDPTKVVRFASRVRIPRSEVERLAGLTKARLKGEVESEIK